jgi:hypothetical protein
MFDFVIEIWPGSTSVSVGGIFLETGEILVCLPASGTARSIDLIKSHEMIAISLRVTVVL